MFEGKSFENIANQIEREDNAEKERAIGDRIDELSLVFSIEKYKQLKKENNDLKFSDVLQKYSTSFAILNDLYHKNSEGDEEADVKINAIKEIIDEMGEGDDIDADQVLNCLDAETVKINKPSARNPQEEKDEKFGLITYKIENGKDNKYESILKKLNFDEHDEAISIHIDEAYKNEGKLDFKEGFSKLALKIKNDFPYVKAVIGRSWLMSLPIADKLGFNKIDDVDIPENQFDTWLQFIDKDGQVSKKRFEKLLQTGEFPHKSAAGYMMTEDFLKKYLPE
jgi:hypothetical protein